ncbi:2',5'-phosphodiesterase 12 isoform X1 [Papilio machaon]|uniref:2',5'-phosphodiesterase 12 isoform X1 n=1 Tax=Papilio machaon TaxID=76193 RepID=UPI001E6649C8|nr:2',5'-phosphodiesterase 12 isoform X1 [Papilio machaon]
MLLCSMIFRLNLLTHKFSTAIKISKTSAMNASKCYFRYVEAEEKIDVSFLLKVKDAVRQFNFRRQPTENIQTLCNRIEMNVQKVMAKKKKKNEKTSVDTKIKIAVLDVNNQEMSDKYSCKDLFDMEGPLKVQICEQFYEAVFNAPWIININLPKSLLLGFPVYPENFETLYTIKEKCDFKWYTGKPVNDQGNVVSDIHINWIPVGNSYSYVPTSVDVGMKLKLECTPGNNNTIGPAVETISTTLVEAGPGPCPFETRHQFTASKLKDSSFRCVSYNILADLYCDSDFTRSVLHPYCPPYALQMDYRKQLILKELEGYNADIYCLQEVDKKIFNNSLEPFLDSIGLKGLFYKKGKTVSEGLACFYRKSRFEMLEEENILLADAIKTLPCLQSIWDTIKDNKPLLDRLLDRSTVASATILQSKDNLDEIVIVANTHLYFHPDADHIRLLQGGIVIYWLSEIKDNLTKKFQYPEKRISLILCGDFNSVPSCGIYQLYTTGIAPDSLPDWQSNANEKISDLCLTNDLLLGSACGTPPFTNFTVGFADCLDYIFYDKNNIEVEQVIPFPSIEELRAHTALPSIVFPSDHIAIISDLRFKR